MPPSPNTDHYHGFRRRTFTVAGCECFLVEPRRALPGRPWVWKAEFFEAFPAAELALVEEGFHLAYITVGNTFGCPAAMAQWDAFYRELTEDRGLAARPSLLGLSRGGLYIYRWTADHPDQVACLYGDNPVCDFRSWPGGRGAGPGSVSDWQLLLQAYEFRSEAEALAYDGNPIDSLQPLAAAGIPILHVCGEADEVVPYEENTVVLRERYESLGGPIEVIVKPGCRHHPHGLDDPAPIVRFVKAHVA